MQTSVHKMTSRLVVALVPSRQDNEDIEMSDHECVVFEESLLLIIVLFGYQSFVAIPRQYNCIHSEICCAISDATSTMRRVRGSFDLRRRCW